MPLTPVSNDLPLEIDRQNHHFRTDHLEDDLGERSARGGAVTLAAQVFKFLLSTVATVILARLLTPQDYGLIGMVAIFVSFVSMFQYLGLSTATVRWSKLDHQQVSTLFWVNLALSTAIMLLTVASAPLVAYFYKEPRLIWITIGYAITIIFSGMAIQHEALLSRQMRFAALAIIEVVSILIGLVSAIVAAWYGAGYWALVLNQLVMTFFTAAGVWVACKWRPGLPAFNTGVRSMLSYGSNLTGFNVSVYLTRNLDNLLIGKVWGAYQLGLYSRAYQMLLMPMQQINAPIGAVAVPALSRLADSPDRYRKAYLKILEKIALITMPGIVFMIATSDWLVLFLLGPQWRETARIFMLLGIAAFIQPVTKTSSWLFSTQGRSGELLRWGLIAGIIAVTSIVIGLPWGAVGIASAYAISDLCITTPLLFWYVGRRGPIRAGDFYRTVAPAVFASICSLTVLLISRPWLAGFGHLSSRLSLALAMVLVVSLLALTALPSGRKAIQDFNQLLPLLFKRKRNVDE
jgi:O-antigen/teichoic acid export membrane protein